MATNLPSETRCRIPLSVKTEVDELFSVDYPVLTGSQIINEFIDGHTSKGAAPRQNRVLRPRDHGILAFLAFLAY